MTGLFSKPIDDFPGKDDERIEQERRARLIENSKRKGRSSTILTGGGGLDPIKTIEGLALNTVLGG